MINHSLAVLTLLFFLLLEGCGGGYVSKPVVISDAENFANDGLQAYEEADWKRAQWLFTRSLSLYQGIDNQNGVLYSHINLAEVALSAQDFSAIDKHLEQATRIAKKDSFKDVRPRITLLYSLSALKQKQTLRAESLLKPLLPQFNIEELVGAADAIQLVAIANQTKIAFVKKQDESLWTNRFTNALNHSLEKTPELEASLLRFQASLYKQAGDFKQAENHLQQALLIYKESLSRSGIAMTLFAIGELYMEEDRWQDAQDYLNRSIDVFRYLKNTEKTAVVSERLLKVDLKLKQF